MVTLGFPESQSFLRAALERRQVLIEQGISAQLGRTVAVRCVASNLDLNAPQDPETDQLMDAARRIFARTSSTSARSRDREQGPLELGRLSASPRGDRAMSMANLQRMAQQMQQEMLRIQSELETLEVDGSAGGGVVRATVTGKQELVSVTIDPSAVDPADVEMLQDLVVAAVNDALRASRQVAESKMAAVTGGLKLPGM